MGVRVEFKIGPADGIESTLLESSILFREWYRDLASDDTSGFRPELLTVVDSMSRVGREALMPRSLDAAMLLDAAVDIFMCDFCTWGPGSGLFKPANTSMLHVRNYAALEPLVEAFGSTPLSCFWRFMLRGRPIARDAGVFPYQPSDPVFRLSFAAAHELAAVGMDLSRLRSGQWLSEVEAAPLYWSADAIDQAMHQSAGLVVSLG